MSQWKNDYYLTTGLSHKRRGGTCQDSVTVQETEYCIAAALADGLGQLKNSEKAAKIATAATVAWFLENYARIQTAEDPVSAVRASLIEYIKGKISAYVERASIDPRTLDCNLAFVCVFKQQNLAIAGCLGDCAVCIMDEEPYVLTADSALANGTDTVLSENASDLMQIEILALKNPKIRGFMLTSDGLDDVLYMKGVPYVLKGAEKYFNSIFENNPKAQLYYLVQDLTAGDSSFDDDISLAILSRAETPIALAEDPTWLCRCGYRNPLSVTYCLACQMDFLELYKNQEFSDFGGKYGFFRHYNRNPEQERKIVGTEPEKTAKTSSKPKGGSGVRSSQKNTETLRNRQAKEIQSSGRGKKPEEKQTEAVEDKKQKTFVLTPMKSTEISDDDLRAFNPFDDADLLENNMIDADSHTDVDTGDEANYGRNTSRRRAQRQNTNRGDRTEWENVGANRNETHSGNRGGAKVAASKRRGLLSLIAVMQVVLLLCVIFFASIILAKIGRIQDQMDDLRKGLAQTEQFTGEGAIHAPIASRENYLDLGGGSFFCGVLQNGEPHGSGILYLNGEYWIGSFLWGEREGVFCVVRDADAADFRIVICEDDAQKEVLYNGNGQGEYSLDDAYRVVEEQIVLYAKPGATDAELLLLAPGDIVFKTDTLAEVDGEQEWVQVSTITGITGWCDAEYIVPVK